MSRIRRLVVRYDDSAAMPGERHAGRLAGAERAKEIDEELVFGQRHWFGGHDRACGECSLHYIELGVAADATGRELRATLLGHAQGSAVSVHKQIEESSETLAGRAGFHELTPITVDLAGDEHVDRLWFRGGFPRSFLAESDESSSLWLENYIRTFLERDIPQLGISIPARTLRRFWTMISHYHGQLLNLSELSRAFGISDKTIGRYLDILAGTFMVRLLQPWYSNVGKRLVRSPRLYVRDSGLFHALQSIETPEGLYAHPKVGASWEGFVLEQAITLLEIGEPYFWRTHTGAELNLFWFRNGKPWGIEVKYNDAPGMTRSLHSVIEDLKPEHVWIVYPGKETWRVHPKATVLPLTGLSGIGEEIR